MVRREDTRKKERTSGEYKINKKKNKENLMMTLKDADEGRKREKRSQDKKGGVGKERRGLER